MKDTIHSIAHCVRTVSEEVTKTKTLRNRCIPVSLVLRHFLEIAGYHAVIAWGYFGARPHSWVMCSDLCIDLTATQFSRGLPAVYIGKLPLSYKLVRAFVPENEIVMVHANLHMLKMAEKIRGRVALVIPNKVK